jgi:ribonuclease E
MTTNPTEPQNADDRWYELQIQLGLIPAPPAAAPVRPPEPPPAPPPPPVAVAPPPALEPDDEPGDELPPIEELDLEAPADALVESLPPAGDEDDAGGTDDEDKGQGDGRKRRRRRRRRRKDRPDDATATTTEPKPSEDAEPIEAPEPAEMNDDVAIEVGGPSDDEAIAEPEPVLEWNVPSWQELISSLYRPER